MKKFEAYFLKIIMAGVQFGSYFFGVGDYAGSFSRLFSWEESPFIYTGNGQNILFFLMKNRLGFRKNKIFQKVKKCLKKIRNGKK